MQSASKIIDIPALELIDKLEKYLKVKLPQSLKENERQLRDFARNKLHGVEFIEDDEEIGKDKHLHKKEFKSKNVNPTECPFCKEKKLLVQPFPKDHPHHGMKYCSNCGYKDIPGGN